MDVFALAPSLLGVGELFRSADEAMNGSDTVVSTDVQSTFKSGSFEILFSVEQHLRDASVSLLPVIPLLGANNLVSAVIGTAVDKTKDMAQEKVVKGLFKLLGVLAGHKPEAIKSGDGSNSSIFLMGSGNTISVDQRTTHLYQNARTMAAANKVALPLKRTGIRVLKARQGSQEITSLEQKDFPELASVHDALTYAIDQSNDVKPQEKIVRIVKPNFSGGKWTVSDGSKPFEVAMDDEDFMKRVHAREVGFYDGDYYRVAMTETQKIDGRGLSTSRTIVRVIDEIRRPTQVPLLPTSTGRKFRLDE
jgi:hypothetical protein